MKDAVGTLARFSYILTCRYRETSKRFFQNSPTHQKCQNGVLHGNTNMDAFPAGTYIYMYIHTYVTWECFSNLETVVTQIEKRTETQPSFNKGSGGPQNKEHNF